MGILRLLVCLALLQSPAPAGQARDDTRGKGEISGRITDQVTRQPIPAASVVLRAGRDSRTATTDADGRYAFTGLAGGSYVVLADGGYERATYLTHVYGDSRAVERAMAVRNTPLVLGDGEARKDVDIALSRAAVVDGRVIDIDGVPLADIEVQAQGVTTGLWKPATARTDDHGRFRLFGLAPGAYRVCVNPSNESLYGSQVPRADRLVRTCYPAVSSESEAGRVEVQAAAPTTIEITAQRFGAFTVTGTIVDANGAPAPTASIALTRAGTFPAVLRGEVANAGRFTISGVTQGRYLLAAKIGPETETAQRGEAVAGYTTVLVENASVEGLTVTVRRGARIGGHLKFLDSPAPSTSSLRMIVETVPESVEYMPAFERPPFGEVNASLEFELTDVFFPLTFVVRDLPAGWAVKSVTLRGADITGVPTSFWGDSKTKDLEIGLTHHVADVFGKVTDETGAASGGGCVLAVRPDARRPLSPASFKSAFVLEDGSYRLDSLPSGDYVVAALAFVDCMRLNAQSAALDRLIRTLKPVTFVEHAEQRLDLRLSSLQEKRP
ncbi:MAG TPA: carboxypeptidase-like regulatory domain-containing protein [Casimicrobiaceae bacterium]